MGYREIIYANYKEDLSERQAFSSFEKERKMIGKYIKRNYLRYLPKDKNARILDLGCGMGHYIYALKKIGYSNVAGVDASESNVRFCLSHHMNVVQDNIVNYLKKVGPGG